MFDRLVTLVQRARVAVATWQVNNRYEKCALALLELAHTGATTDWISEIIEVRGRHALAVTHH